MNFENDISEEQFAFLQGRGTVEANFALTQTMVNTEKNRDDYTWYS